MPRPPTWPPICSGSWTTSRSEPGGFQGLSGWPGGLGTIPGVAASLAVIGLLVMTGLAGLGIGLVRFREQAQGKPRRGRSGREDSQGRRARVQAEAARRRLSLTLTDMHTSQGVVAGQPTNQPRPCFGLPTPVRLAREDPEREPPQPHPGSHLGAGAFTPIHGFRRAGGYGDFEQFAFHPGGRYLLVQNGSQTEGPDFPSGLSIWDLEQEQPLPLPEAAATASSATWSPDGRELVFGCLTGSVTVASFPAGDLERQIQFDAPVTWLTFSSDGRFLAIAAGSTARVWDCRGRVFATRELRHPAAIDALVFNPKGDRLATACQDGRCRVYAMTGDSAEPSFAPVPHVSKRPRIVPGSKVTPPLFVSDGRELLTRDEKDLLWWNAKTGEKVRSVPRGYMARMSLPPQGRRRGQDSRGALPRRRQCVITLSPNGKYIALGEGRAGLGIAQLFDAETGHAIFASEYRNSVASLAFSPDSRRLLIGSTDNSAELRSVPSGQLIGQPLVHAASIYHVGFAPDGQSFATAQDGGMIRVWAIPRQNPRVSGSHGWHVFIRRNQSRWQVPAAHRNEPDASAQLPELAFTN